MQTYTLIFFWHLNFCYRETSRDARLKIIVSTENHLIRNALFVYIFSVWKNKITMKLGALSVNDENIINKISCDLGKVTKCALYLRRLFCSCLHMVEVISPGHIYSLWMVQTDTYVSFWLLNFCFPMFLIHYLNPRIRDLL